MRYIDDNGVLENLKVADSSYIIFSVGDGSSETTRHNVFEVRNNQISYVNSQPIVVSYQGPVTKLWRGTAADYSNLRNVNKINEHTLYAIDDGTGFNKDGLVFKQEFEDLVKRVKYLETIIQDVVFRATASNGSGVNSPSNPTYLWVGTKGEYNNINHPDNTVFITN